MPVTFNEEFLNNSPSGRENRTELEILFEFKEIIFSLVTVYSDPIDVNFDLHSVEFAIQEAFGFKRDVNFHRFWEWPFCDCPLLDNIDRIGTFESVFNHECVLHGRNALTTNGWILFQDKQ